MDPLRTELRALASSLQSFGIPLIVGGGYGLLLRSERLRKSKARTLLSEVPVARSTEDIDVFLKAEIVADPEKMKPIREALDQRHYEAVVENFQFVRRIDYGGRRRSVKIDFLAAPVQGERAARVKMDDTRIRPRGSYKRLHARTTPEALTIEQHLSPVSTGEDDEAPVVFLPHPFSYVLLKLFAVRDQANSEEKEYGRHHAYDIYATIAMMTEDEWHQAIELRDLYSTTEQMFEARTIANELFADAESLGTLRLREHARSIDYDLSTEQLIELLAALRELLPDF